MAYQKARKRKYTDATRKRNKARKLSKHIALHPSDSCAEAARTNPRNIG